MDSLYIGIFQKTLVLITCIFGFLITHFRLDDINPNYVSVWFYDQRKRHFGGKGITGGYIQLLSPTKIRWKLDELTGIWNETEGDESISDAERRPIGFSVPDDVIMTKE